MSTERASDPVMSTYQNARRATVHPRRLGSTEILMTVEEKAGRARHQEQAYKIVHGDVAEFAKEDILRITRERLES